MKHTKRYRKPEWCSTQSRSPRITEQPDRRTGTTFCYLRSNGVVKHFKRERKQRFTFEMFYNTVATFSQPHAVLLLTNQIRISLFAQLSHAKSEIHIWLVDSHAIWDKFAQLVYSRTIHTLNTYMIMRKSHTFCTEHIHSIALSWWLCVCWHV